MTNIQQITSAAKSFACGVYKMQPGSIVGNPISNILKMSWDELCADDPGGLPPAPERPFDGGQCVGVKYLIRLNYKFPGEDFERGEEHYAWGEFGGVVVVFDDSQPGFKYHIEVLCRGNAGSVSVPSVLKWWRGFNTFQGAPQYIRLTVVRREDNQPDNCGNLPDEYPASPPPPEDGYESQPVRITYNDGTDVNVTFNLQPPKSGDNTTPPDVCMTASVGGDNFDVCFPFGNTPQIGNVESDVERKLRELQYELRSFRDKYDRDTTPPAPEDDTTLSPLPLGGQDGGEADAPGVSWLVVTLTEQPDKSQFGTPTVFFAGWVTFRVGNAYTERQPIAYERSVFKAPEGADGYGVTFANKAAGTVLSYVKQQF